MLKTNNSAATAKLVISEDHGSWTGQCANWLSISQWISYDSKWF